MVPLPMTPENSSPDAQDTNGKLSQEMKSKPLDIKMMTRQAIASLVKTKLMKHLRLLMCLSMMNLLYLKNELGPRIPLLESGFPLLLLFRNPKMNPWLMRTSL